MMTEYALLVGGVFREIRALPERPPAILHKQVAWYPVVRDFGDTFEGLDGDNYLVITPEPEAPDPGLTPPREIAAAFGVTVENGDISSIGGAFNLIGALYLDVGQYMLLFLRPEPDANYFGQPIGGAPCMQIGERGEDYLIVDARESAGGSFVEVDSFSVQIYRI